MNRLLPSLHRRRNRRTGIGRIVTYVGTAALAAALAAACTATQPARDFLEYRAADAPVAVAERLQELMRACWFEAGAAAFAGYAYTPEIDSNRARLLVVPAGSPGGLPKLVIEASPAGTGSRIKLFGPLLASAEGGRIQADIGRWAADEAGC